MSVENRRTPPVRTPDPLASSRRRAFERLGSLRAMGLGAIGDIGSVLFGATDSVTVTWSSSSDWDNGQSETRVVSEAYGDLEGADVIQPGFPSSTLLGGTDLLGHYPFHETSGTTATDVSGNGNDGTYDGGTLGAAGPLNHTAVDLDGTDDSIDTPITFSGSENRCIVQIVKLDSFNDGDTLNAHGTTNTSEKWIYRSDFGDLRIETSGSSYISSLSPVADGSTWETIAIDLNGNDYTGFTLYLSGSTETPGSGQGTLNTSTNNAVTLGSSTDVQSGAFPDLDGTHGPAFVFGRSLSVSELDTIHNTLSSAEFITSIKSFSNPSQPDLQNLDYDLNGESVTLDVYGSPGTASEEIVSQSLDGSTGFSLSWTDTHTDFKIQINWTHSAESAPVVRSLTLST